jgi:hypothetical protein
MKKLLVNRWCPALWAIAGIVLASCSSAPPEGKSASVALFNGRDLTGWKSMTEDPKVKPESIWSVKDGILICRGEPLGCLATEASYTNYRLEVEYRWAPGGTPGNSGLFGRINGQPRALPRCLEVQLKHGNAGDVLGLQGMKVSGPADRFKFIAKHEVAGDICVVGRIKGAEEPAGQWNKVEVLVRADKARVWFNGKKVNEASGVEITAGPVALQSEGGEIHFRNVRITRLKD